MPTDIAFIEFIWDELHAELLGRVVVGVEELVVVEEEEELVVVGVVGVDDPVEGEGAGVETGDVAVVVPAVAIPPTLVLAVFGIGDGLGTDGDDAVADGGMALLSVIENAGLALPESPITV